MNSSELREVFSGVAAPKVTKLTTIPSFAGDTVTYTGERLLKFRDTQLDIRRGRAPVPKLHYVSSGHFMRVMQGFSDVGGEAMARQFSLALEHVCTFYPVPAMTGHPQLDQERFGAVESLTHFMNLYAVSKPEQRDDLLKKEIIERRLPNGLPVSDAVMDGVFVFSPHLQTNLETLAALDDPDWQSRVISTATNTSAAPIFGGVVNPVPGELAVLYNQMTVYRGDVASISSLRRRGVAMSEDQNIESGANNTLSLQLAREHMIAADALRSVQGIKDKRRVHPHTVH
jgi:hypothetical protein